jgi:hypothetical protein
MRKHLSFKNKCSDNLLFDRFFFKLGTDTDNIEDESECTEEQKKCARRRVRKSKA